MRKDDALSLSELARSGITIEEYSGPTVRVSRRWLWSAAILASGTAAVWMRERVRGRVLVWWVPTSIYLGGGLLVLLLLVRQVHRLRRLPVEDPRLIFLGWGVGGVAAAPSLRGSGSKGWRAGVGSPVIGLFTDELGLAVLVDQAGVGLVRPTTHLRLTIGVRGDRRWLIIAEGDATVVLRLFGTRMP